MEIKQRDNSYSFSGQHLNAIAGNSVILGTCIKFVMDPMLPMTHKMPQTLLNLMCLLMLTVRWFIDADISDSP